MRLLLNVLRGMLRVRASTPALSSLNSRVRPRRIGSTRSRHVCTQSV